MAAPATVIHTVGSKVWVPDAAETWIKAEVQKIETGKDGAGILIVALEDSAELRRVPASDAPLQNTDTRGVEVRVGVLRRCEPCIAHILLQQVTSSSDDLAT